MRPYAYHCYGSLPFLTSKAISTHLWPSFPRATIIRAIRSRRLFDKKWRSNAPFASFLYKQWDPMVIIAIDTPHYWSRRRLRFELNYNITMNSGIKLTWFPPIPINLGLPGQGLFRVLWTIWILWSTGSKFPIERCRNRTFILPSTIESLKLEAFLTLAFAAFSDKFTLFKLLFAGGHAILCWREREKANCEKEILDGRDFSSL